MNKEKYDKLSDEQKNMLKITETAFAGWSRALRGWKRSSNIWFALALLEFVGGVILGISIAY